MTQINEITTKYQRGFNNDRESHLPILSNKKSEFGVALLSELKSQAIEPTYHLNATMGSLLTEVAPANSNNMS